MDRFPVSIDQGEHPVWGVKSLIASIAMTAALAAGSILLPEEILSGEDEIVEIGDLPYTCPTEAHLRDPINRRRCSP